MEVLNITVIAVLTALKMLAMPTMAGLVLFVSNELYYMVINKFGRKMVLVTGVIGTPIHEIAHALTAFFFGMKVTKIDLFKPDPVSSTLGSVEYRYVPTKHWHKIGMFFVGLAPLLAGSYLVLAIFKMAELPTLFEYTEYKTTSIFVVDSYFSVKNWIVELFYHINSWQALAWVVLAMAIGQHSTPSKADMKGTLVGVLTVVLSLSIGILVVMLLSNAGVQQVADKFTYSLNHVALAIIQLAIFSTLCGLALTTTGAIINRVMVQIKK